jgi:hypothetical protein
MRIYVYPVLLCLSALVFAGETCAADPDLPVYLPMDDGQGLEEV